MKTFLNHPVKDVTKVLERALPQPHAFEDQKTTAFQAGPYRIISSDNDRFENDERWQHVSFSRTDRMPSYEELKSCRMTFFPADAEVVQVFPPEAEFVNCHPYCLHLWWSKDRRLVPPQTQSAVGPR